MSRFDLIIFDCDGVLVDSEPIGNRVLAQCVSQLGLPMDAAEAMRRFRGSEMAECVRRVFGFARPDDVDSHADELHVNGAVVFESMDQLPGLLACGSE